MKIVTIFNKLGQKYTFTMADGSAESFLNQLMYQSGSFLLENDARAVMMKISEVSTVVVCPTKDNSIPATTTKWGLIESVNDEVL